MKLYYDYKYCYPAFPNIFQEAAKFELGYLVTNCIYSSPRTSKQLTVHHDTGGRLALWYHIYGYGWHYGIISTV